MCIRTIFKFTTSSTMSISSKGIFAFGSIFILTNFIRLSLCQNGEKMELFKSDLLVNANGEYLRQEIHQHLTPEERIVLFGHVHNVPEYELISSISSPYFGVNNHRRKRSIDSNQPINIEFKAFGELFRLFLWPNHGLLSPTFQLSKQNESNNGTIFSEKEKNVRKELSDCFYQGYDKAHAESAVAISLCNGMQGVIETKPSIYMINPVPQATSERIFSHKNKSNNSTKSNEKYYLILKRKDLHQYYCPHARHKNNPFVQRQNHLKNDNENLYKDNSFIANKLYEQQAQGRLVQRRLTKRSIDIIASNRNFLNADKTTTSTTTPSPSTGFSDTLPIWAPSLTSTSTTETPSMSSPPESINEIMNDVSNGTNNGNNNDLLNSPNFNITVETAVFVDESLYHILSKTFPIDTEQQIVLYVLTIMNAVQLLFKQPSLGRSVDISVVLMDLLRQQPKNLTPSDNIDTYLTNFCVWQHKKRLKESGGPTPDWDHALLLSGINMYVVDGYGRRKRHVVGLAPVSGMCNSLNSCTISEGTNFQTVLVAGHEMGHSLGMEHDGSQDGNSCNKDDFVMSPTLGPGKTTWSDCSRHYLNKFVQTSQATCVLGRSSHVNIIHQFISPHSFPGERFNVDEQCRFRFGPTARHYSLQPKSEICRVIKCIVKSPSKHGFYSGRSFYPFPVKTTYNTHPALEGTECGLDQWCREGRCVSMSNKIKSFNEIEHNLISNRYVTLDLNTTKLLSNIGITRISNRTRKRPTVGPNKSTDLPNDKMDVYHRADPYHYKYTDQLFVVTSTMAPITSTNNDSATLGTNSTTPSPILLGNLYKSADLNSISFNDSFYSIDTNETNYVSDNQHNPYNQPGNEIYISRHWSSNRLNQNNTSLNGNWSDWSKYGPCISECIATGDATNTMLPLGIQTSIRHCKKSNLINNELDCPGPDTRVKLCNAIKTCSAASATSAASGPGAKYRESLDKGLGKRYQIRSVDEYISDTCLAAAKLNDKIENHGTQYPSYDSTSHSCYVWCFKRGGGFMTQGWRLPDGTLCGRKLASNSSISVTGIDAAKDSIEISGYCYNGQCRSFNCHGEIFLRHSIYLSSSSTNVFNGAQNKSTLMEVQETKNNCSSNYNHVDIINELEDQGDDLDYNNYDTTYQLIHKDKSSMNSPFSTTISSAISNKFVTNSTIATQNPYAKSNWSNWHPVTECQYSIVCIKDSRGFRLVTRECQQQTCLGRREALQLCDAQDGPERSDMAMYDLYEQYCPISSRRTANEYARSICLKYQIKFPSLLSGVGRQLMGAKNFGCIVACEDRLWKDIHYQMDAFDDGKFPFGTDCSTHDRRGYCLNGKCIHFGKNGISYDTSESVLYRNEILQLFAPSTIFSIPVTLAKSFDNSDSILKSSLPSITTDNLLYSAIFNQELYKRATSTNTQPTEYQPAYQSFISRRIKRDLNDYHDNSQRIVFRKASLQEQVDPEEEYVSWTMLRHHRRQRNPIARKKSFFNTKKDRNSLKPLRPIKLTSISRKPKALQNREVNSSDHFKTFTLVKPLWRKNRWIGTIPSMINKPIGMRFTKNSTFLDDDEEEEENENDDNNNVQNKKMNLAFTKKNNLTIKQDILASRKKQIAKFGMGHESWPPSSLLSPTSTTSIIDTTKKDNNDSEDNSKIGQNDDYSLVDQTEDQLRVEPYVWSVILSECNMPCGQGVRTVRVVCTVGQNSVKEHFCDPNTKPMHKSIELCKQRDCIGRWRTEPWSNCFSMAIQQQICNNQTNTKLTNSYQTRTIACVGPMMVFEHYERVPTTNSIHLNPTGSRSAESEMGMTNDPETISNPNHKSPRIFSLLNHDFCDPSTKPIQWRPCHLNPLVVASKCNNKINV